MTNKIYALFFSLCSIFFYILCAAQEITPYKFKDHPYEIPYEIPASSRFTSPRDETGFPEIVYYLTKPQQKSYPIAIVCGGSSHKENAGSIIPLHRYFLKEFLDLGCAVVTIEQWGIDGNFIDREIFMQHYTRSQRLKDHQTVINSLIRNRPEGWDGTFVLLGASEGGPLVTTLTEHNQHMIRATINWCGAGDMSWDDELWLFIQDIRKNSPWYIKLFDLLPQWLQYSYYLPKTKSAFDDCMRETRANPCIAKLFMGMTYQYHADTLQYPAHDYHKLKSPFLVVAGTRDSIISSSDAFIEKAKAAGTPITYIRVDGMDHYIRKRPDVIEQSFNWLKKILSC